MSMLGIDEGNLRRAFLEDAEDLVQKLGQSLLRLEKEGKNPALVNEIFRLLHSLKSESALLGFSVFSRLAHRMEDVFGLARDGAVALDKGIMDCVLAGSDRIAEMLAAIGREGSDAGFDIEALAQSLSRAAPQAPSADMVPENEEAIGEDDEARAFSEVELKMLEEARDRGESFFQLAVTVDEGEQMMFPRAYLVFSALELEANVVKTVPPMRGNLAEDSRYRRTVIYLTTQEEEPRIRSAAAVDQICSVELTRLAFGVLVPSKREELPSTVGVPPAQQAVESARRPTPEKTTIRVDTRKLDDLWSLIIELIQQKSRVSRMHDRLSRGAGAQELREELGGSFDTLDRISAGMRHVMMETRMVPISAIFSKFPRLVRDLSRKLGKSVELAVSGEETEIDRGIIEALSDPLTHIIRNSIDHGLEFPEERVRLGKPEKGRVRISAYPQGRGIVIELEDDGRGIDLELVREKAAAMGIPGALDMEETRLLDLLFLPGFSTKDVVTDLSGRGVGMDVVATRVRGDLKGEVTMNSVPGEGTLITLLLPLTMAIMNTLLVRAENIVYALPLSGVDATVKVLNTEIRWEKGRRSCAWMDVEIPLFYLGAVGGKGLPSSEEYFAVILSYGMDRACLIVDELLEEQEIVIKPIDDLLNGGGRFSGVSVLEDGTPVFILDISFVQGGSL
jgi:two-component system chemotaxis sensor kinase CheA